ncbi:hypothetical protein niasHT_024607 [Heterodera trifolii]|uniref:G-protein coupled receptors family 1 profile domain-containing protein n=1 Tax=Heterodera trifolii TaxID=157864 RepID=A0ABD2K7H5_9BILA
MMASINTSSNDPLYLAYRFAGPSADLIVPAVALSLRGSANFLMALICLCELVHQIGHTFFLVIVISGINFVSLLTADFFMTPMIFALNCGLMTMFCTSVDRLFAIISPIKHSFICAKFKLPYLLGHLSICVIYGALIQYFVLAYAFENAGNPTTGFVVETLEGSVGYKFFAGTFIISLCSIFCYISIFVIIRSKNGVTNHTNTRLLRSLAIILSISVGNYLTNPAIFQLLYAFGNSLGTPIGMWQIKCYLAILLNAAAGSNAIVLYFSSTEYHQNFQKEFRAMIERFGNKNGNLNLHVPDRALTGMPGFFKTLTRSRLLKANTRDPPTQLIQGFNRLPDNRTVDNPTVRIIRQRWTIGQ